ncbi:MAG TPA: type 1 glutamine amidotransferase [Gaiellaceae bacterium]
MGTDIRLAVLQHEPETGLGRFADLFRDFAVDYELVRTTRGTLPDPRAFDGAVALGGSLSVSEATLLPTRRWIRELVRSGLPYLGVCLGGQLLARAQGARVVPGGAEAGIHSVFLTDAAQHDVVFEGLPRQFDAFGWHGERFDLPRGAVPLAGSLACTYQAFRYGDAAYSLQFHPEVRPEDLAAWRNLPGYRRLLDESAREWADVELDLTQAATALDGLSTHLLERWLGLVAGAASPRARRPVLA